MRITLCVISPSVCGVCVCPPVLGKIRSAVGSAQLLMSQKFQQFYWLCQQNLVSIYNTIMEQVCVFKIPLMSYILTVDDLPTVQGLRSDD